MASSLARLVVAKRAVLVAVLIGTSIYAQRRHKQLPGKQPCSRRVPKGTEGLSTNLWMKGKQIGGSMQIL